MTRYLTLFAACAVLLALLALAFCIGGASYYYVFYRSNLIPRWLSAWGLIALVLVLAVTVVPSTARYTHYSLHRSAV